VAIPATIRPMTALLRSVTLIQRLIGTSLITILSLSDLASYLRTPPDTARPMPRHLMFPRPGFYLLSSQRRFQPASASLCGPPGGAPPHDSAADQVSEAADGGRPRGSRPDCAQRIVGPLESPSVLGTGPPRRT